MAVLIFLAPVATMFLFGYIVSIARRIKEDLDVGVQTLIGSLLCGFIMFVILSILMNMT